MIVVEKESTESMKRAIFVPQSILDIFYHKHLDRNIGLGDIATCLVTDNNNTIPEKTLIHDCLVYSLRNFSVKKITKIGDVVKTKIPIHNDFNIFVKNFDSRSIAVSNLSKGSFFLEIRIIAGLKDIAFALEQYGEKNSNNTVKNALKGDATNKIGFVVRHLHVVPD